MNNWNMPWGMPLQGYPPNVYDFNIPYNVFQGHGLTNGFGQFDYNALRMNNNPFHQQLQPPYINPVVNIASHPQNLSQQNSSIINPVSVNQTTQKMSAVRTENALGSEQPSTSASTPRHRDIAPTGILVCFE